MEDFKKQVNDILKIEYLKDIYDATNVELYNAISKALMLKISDTWKKQNADNVNKKRAYYLSAEFLTGRHINNNILNLNVESDINALLQGIRDDVNNFEDIEDCALGNGGLGRLAACFLESAATCGYVLNGYGIRYRYGLFKQEFEDGFQCENIDDWTRFGDPWSIRAEKDKVEISFSDQTVYAVPYDTPVIGYGGKTINTLRLWQCEPKNKLDFAEFNKLKYAKALAEKNDAEIISDCLYPNDEKRQGKVLRLKQEYFFASASLQDIIRANEGAFGNDICKLKSLVTLQLNDTHPVIAIPELIRILVKKGYDFDKAFDLCQSIFAFTNHTIMGEALEKWDIELMSEILPEIYEIICKIQKRLEDDLKNKKITDTSKFMIITDNVVHMARLAVYVCKSTNGVAAIHTEILKDDVFANWYKLYPEKFQNKTNGITPRRWLMLANPKLTKLIENTIGDGFKDDLCELKKLLPKVNDINFLSKFKEIKHENKVELAEYILKKEGIKIDDNSIFDIQIKRLHEYKRQLMNAFCILYLYNGILDKSIIINKPITFIFGAKSAPSYYNAKAIIKFINEIANKVNNDSKIKGILKVVFVENYNVSYAEKLVSAADISEQISLAGMEASGTGNMKFMLNGTVTLGTLDGATVEIAEEAGKENNYIFGATVEEIQKIKDSYNPVKIYKNDKKIKAVIDTLIDGSFSDNGTGMFKRLHKSLVNNPKDVQDRYFILHDLKSYVDAKLKLIEDFGSDDFYKKSIINMACSGKFSSDRTIREYAHDIWNLD